MDIRLGEIESFFEKQKPCILISVKEVKGSTPRNLDAFMLIDSSENIGTIGGGNLEFLAIKKAKEMLLSNESEQIIKVLLGVDSNQCCGGWVKLKLQILDEKQRQNLLRKITDQESSLPHIYLFGAGHVGKALANLLVFMPYKTSLIDTRQNVMNNISPLIITKTTPLPETIIREAKPNSAFVIFTHDHALDFLILAEVLKRNDAIYAGMIGSKTKRKKFENWYKNQGNNQTELVKITCPIGGQEIVDKRPAIIAALTLGEIIANMNFF